MGNKGNIKKLPQTFYSRPDVLQISKELLGKFIVSNFNGERTAGMIVETEAYAGETDKASHAYNGRKTQRTQIMYRDGGVAYVYLIYGIYHLFNIVTGSEDVPHAVLIRAVEPAEGTEIMLRRRGLAKVNHRLCGGPGLLTQALGITGAHTGLSLSGDTIWLEDRGLCINKDDISEGPRIGVDYAGEHAKLPWRFQIRDNIWVSRRKSLRNL